MPSASRAELIEVFTGLPPRVFRKLVGQVERWGGKLVADGIRGRPWSLSLADRMLLVATYYRANLTMASSPCCSAASPPPCIGSSTDSAGTWLGR